ncbi:MAG: hypothetical protein OXH84_01860 [Gammaproteobacteria bacterium]|nr:hypothetical protein [Gammaproteobacteria bacterium]
MWCWRLARGSHWIWGVALFLCILYSDWFNDLLERLDLTDKDSDAYQEALDDCVVEGGVLIEEADYDEAVESAEEHGIDVSVAFQRDQYICLIYSFNLPEPEEENDEDP